MPWRRALRPDSRVCSVRPEQRRARTQVDPEPDPPDLPVLLSTAGDGRLMVRDQPVTGERLARLLRIRYPPAIGARTRSDSPTEKTAARGRQRAAVCGLRGDDAPPLSPRWTVGRRNLHGHFDISQNVRPEAPPGPHGPVDRVLVVRCRGRNERDRAMQGRIEGDAGRASKRSTPSAARRSITASRSCSSAATSAAAIRSSMFSPVTVVCPPLYSGRIDSGRIDDAVLGRVALVGKAVTVGVDGDGRGCSPRRM